MLWVLEYQLHDDKNAKKQSKIIKDNDGQSVSSESENDITPTEDNTKREILFSGTINTPTIIREFSMEQRINDNNSEDIEQEEWK